MDMDDGTIGPAEGWCKYMPAWLLGAWTVARDVESVEGNEL